MNRIVGQNESVYAVSDAVCEHLHPGRGFDDGSGPHYASAPTRPLIVSVHGPPGVGKSYTHQQLARGLFMKNPFDDSAPCPGEACPQYRVLMGMDWTSRSRKSQARQLRREIITHLERFPNGALLVIGEYDKLDCSMRTFFRTLFDASTGYEDRSASLAMNDALRENADAARQEGEEQASSSSHRAEVADMAALVADGVLTDKVLQALRRSVIILESNLGMAEMLLAGVIEEEPASKAWTWRSKDPHKLKLEQERLFKARSKALKRAVHEAWLDQQCESATDTARWVQHVDLFVPYGPLDVQALRDLTRRLLRRRAWNVQDRVTLVWNKRAIDRLVSLVEMHDGIATEGGKEITDVVGRQVSRALRKFFARTYDEEQDEGIPVCALTAHESSSNVECA